jgi:hypothetical protein
MGDKMELEDSVDAMQPGAIARLQGSGTAKLQGLQVRRRT